jgi:hypothetical protein
MNNRIKSSDYLYSLYPTMENINNSKLHLYFWLDRRQEFKCDMRVNTSQREHYWGTVHLFIGTGHSPGKIKFVSLISNHNQNTSYRGLDGLLLFKSVLPFVSRRVVMPMLLGL